MQKKIHKKPHNSKNCQKWSKNSKIPKISKNLKNSLFFNFFFFFEIFFFFAKKKMLSSQFSNIRRTRFEGDDTVLRGSVRAPEGFSEGKPKAAKPRGRSPHTAPQHSVSTLNTFLGDSFSTLPLGFSTVAFTFKSSAKSLQLDFQNNGEMGRIFDFVHLFFQADPDILKVIYFARSVPGLPVLRSKI